ncbi:MAG: polysaccharide biosynthesis protein [Pseudomonadales bacterium]|nr:polysaccharide biosynthesis protein [Pseudomonadales bacterium]
MFSDNILLITGGTGSFGNAVLERFLNTNIKEIRIFSRDELKQEEMRIRLDNPKVKFYIGDVRDYDSILAAMAGVDLVFQAAALKQVPSCEFYPLEAVKTNIMGTENVLKAAIVNHVERVIVLSTDKAVYPINAMGISKAMMEKVTIAKSRLTDPKQSTICCTRYGNVMASRGSVIPLFIKQIKDGKPLTVTDPNMTRFLMSLDDAIDLVLYAFENSRQGDIFVQKAPAATVGDLAQALKEIFESTCNIDIIGTRHGEKLYETLLTREEIAHAEDMGGYYRIPADNRDLNYGKYFVEGKPSLSITEDYNSHNTLRLDVEGIKSRLLLVPYVQAQLGV